jgi:hypothetical protein
VIARGHHVDAPLEQLIADLTSHTEPGGGILGICDDQIDSVEIDDPRKPAPDQVTPGLADDVSYEQEADHVNG